MGCYCVTLCRFVKLDVVGVTRLNMSLADSISPVVVLPHCQKSQIYYAEPARICSYDNCIQMQDELGGTLHFQGRA